MATIARPAMVLSTSTYCRIACPSAEAVAPSRMNTVAKPATNRSAVRIARRRTPQSSRACNSSSVTPARNER
jgi:hypothetical protein